MMIQQVPSSKRDLSEDDDLASPLIKCKTYKKTEMDVSKQ
jgi:hypothetical protein